MKAAILIGILILGLGSIALASNKQIPHKPIRSELKARYAQLNLTPEQATTLKRIRSEYLSKKAQIIPGENTRKELIKLRIKTRKQFNEVLTPEQQLLARKISAERRQQSIPKA